jgi:hypothetical protein
VPADAVTEIDGLLQMGQLVARMHAEAEAADAADGAGGAHAMEVEPCAAGGESGRRRLGAETIPEAPPSLD